MFNDESEMKYSLSYQHKDLLGIGIIQLITFGLCLLFTYFWILRVFFLTSLLTIPFFFLFFIVFALIMFFRAISNIILGRKRIKLEIDDVNIRKFENEKLKIKITVKKIKEIIYTYPDELNWRQINFHLSNKKKIKIIITNKRDLTKVEELITFLVCYCKKYNIPFKADKINTRAFVYGFKKKTKF